MASSIFNSKPNPTRAFARQAQKAAGKDVIIVASNDPTWEAAKTALDNGIPTMVPKNPVTATQPLAGTTVYLIKPDGVQARVVEFVVDFYTHLGCTTWVGAPSRFERDEVV